MPGPEYTDPTTSLADVAPGEVALSAMWNTYVANNVESVATASAATITDLEDHWGGSTVAQRSGRFGILRVGSSPFDFLTVAYDDTLDKWISPTYSFGSSGEKPNSGSAGDHVTFVMTRTASGNNYYWGPMIPWSALDTAGVKPQFRWLWVVNNESSDNWYISRRIQGMDIGANFGTIGSAVGSVATGTNSAPILQGDAETAWTDHGLGGPSDYICPGLQLATDVAPSNTTSNLYHATFLWRWVSQ